MNGEWLGWLVYFHISPPMMFAGFCGGIVNIFHFHRTKKREFIGAIVCGALTANFVGDEMGHYAGEVSGIFSSFVIGWFGLKWVASVIRKKVPGLLFEEDKPT